MIDDKFSQKLADMKSGRKAGDAPVIVYGTPTCPYCVIAKRYLSEKGVKYADIDVSRDQKSAFEMMQKSGQMGVPVIDIEGTIIIGFNRPAIDAALGK